MMLIFNPDLLIFWRIDLYRVSHSSGTHRTHLQGIAVFLVVQFPSDEASTYLFGFCLFELWCFFGYWALCDSCVFFSHWTGTVALICNIYLCVYIHLYITHIEKSIHLNFSTLFTAWWQVPDTCITTKSEVIQVSTKHCFVSFFPSQGQFL